MAADLPTREDLFQVGAQEVFARGAVRPERLRITPTAVFTQGTDINVVIAACSAMGDEGIRHLALRMAALFLDSAEDEDLDRLIADRFSPEVVRKQAGPAVVDLLFARPIPPSAGLSVSIPVGFKHKTAAGTEFTLTEAVSFPLNSAGPQFGAAVAVLAGSAGNVGANQITQFSQPPDDPTIVVTNPDVAAGGQDVESNASLRERARDFFRTARRGTFGAIEFGALTVDGVVAAHAVETLGPDGLPTGQVQLFIADSLGQSNAILATAVRNALLEFRAGGIVVQVVTTTPRFESIAYQLQFRAGTDTRAAAQQLKALTVAAVNLLAPGEPLQQSLLLSLARSIPGAVVPVSAVQVPAGDVLPDPGQVIKTDLSRVLVNGS
jgi:uncharacterized phage protein gp47/JayE